MFTKCGRRLIPFLALLYFVNYLDRVNAGFAALTMNHDLGFSASVFGFGAGILFAGYLLFQIPGNTVLLRAGARRWLALIMIVWGLLSAGTAFVSGPLGFYMLRFLLGIAEAGLFPGIMFYLGLWFPKVYRVRFSAAFVCAIPLSGVVGAPLSATILGMEDFLGLHGWQWLFILEGLPASLLGLMVLRFLADGPADAAWLSQAERGAIAARLAAETTNPEGSIWLAIRDPRILLIAVTGIASGSALYGTSLWLPQMVSAMGFSHFATGIVVALIYLATIAMMMVWGYSSDRYGERFRHVAVAWLIAAAGFALAGFARESAVQLVGLVFAVAAIPSAIAPYFTLPSIFVRGPAEAAGIAALNTLVSVGGFAGPALIGVLKDRSGSYASGMTMLAIELVVAATIMLAIDRATRAGDAAVAGAKSWG